MLKALKECIIYGGLRAIAAARGDGKTSMTVWAGIWAICYERHKFLTLFGSTGPSANGLLNIIKYNIETNDLLNLHFPKVCGPIRALEGSSQRARSQLYQGELTKLIWQKEEIKLAEIKGPTCGSVILARGIDSSIRGLNRNGMRPGMAIIDDPQTRESAASPQQINTRRETINQDIMGLAGPGGKIACIVLCTVIKKGDLADELTDRKLSPNWNGIKQKFIISWPENKELWEKYIYIRQECQIEGEATGRKAHQFYLDNRAEMDKGVIVNNPYRFDPELEASAIEFAYNKIANMGKPAFDAEFQNDPAEANTEQMDISAATVAKKVNGIARGVMPPSCGVIVRGIDVGAREITWVDVGIGEKFICNVIDYGVVQVHSPSENLLENVEARKHAEAAIYEALMTILQEQPYDIALTGIDSGSGLHQRPVYEVCRGNNGKVRALKGYGGKQGKYRRPVVSGLRAGRGWHTALMKKPTIWLYHIDSDYWKQQVHSGFVIDSKLTGSISLFGDEPVKHNEFSRQIVAELWTRSYTEGKGWKEGFVVHSRNNHFLDAMAYALALGDMAGVKMGVTRLDVETKSEAYQSKKRRLTQQDINQKRAANG